MIESVVTAAFHMIMALVFVLINIITIPIDAAINATLPALGDAFTNVGTYITVITSGLGWAISVTGIPPQMIALIGLFMIFKLTVPLNLYFIKLAAKYYMTVKR